MATYTRFKMVDFGPENTGLGTVTATLMNPDGSVNTAAVTLTEIDAPLGVYGAILTFPAGFIGWIRYSTGGVSPAILRELINPGSDEYLNQAISTPVFLDSSEHTQITSDAQTAYQELFGGLAGAGTVSDLSPQNNSFVISLNAPLTLPSTGIGLVGRWVGFTSGQNILQKQQINGYSFISTNKAQVSFNVPFNNAPAHNDTFQIL